MLVTILARDAGVDTGGGAAWYAKAAEWGVENGITDGLNLDANITREQFAALLYRYAQMKKSDTAGTTDLTAYADAEDISDWATEAMAWANAKGILTGRTESTLAPLGTATRAEAAALLQRFVSGL
jgi:hypothetical protein